MINKHKSLKKTKVKIKLSQQLYYLSAVNNFISSFKTPRPLAQRHPDSYHNNL